MKLALPSNEKLMVSACIAALFALALMIWSVFSPTVWPVMIAISLGQLVGTCSFALFLIVVARDLDLGAVLGRLRRRVSPRSEPEPATTKTTTDDRPPASR